MSYDMTDVVHQMILPASEKAVLLALAHCYNSDTKRCFPSIDTLAQMTGMSPRSIYNNRDKLAENGLITFKSSHGRISCRYYIDINKLRSQPCIWCRVDDENDSNHATGAINHATGAVNHATGAINHATGSPKQVINKEVTKKEQGNPPLNGDGKSKPHRIDFKNMVEKMRTEKAAEQKKTFGKKD